jgi:hypothetical protein
VHGGLLGRVSRFRYPLPYPANNFSKMGGVLFGVPLSARNHPGGGPTLCPRAAVGLYACSAMLCSDCR